MGYYYYHFLDTSLFSQLETQFSSSLTAARNISNDVLFGMAIHVLVQANEYHHLKAVTYFEAAARSSSISAQAVFQRISDVAKCDLDLQMSLSSDDRRQWLFNGVTSGSLIAMEDLRRLDPLMAGAAVQEFRVMGGYNENVSPALKAQLIRWTNSVVPSPIIHGMNDVLDKWGNCPIHYAASFGLVDCLKTLVQRGALVNQKNSQGETPLYKACLAASVEGIKFLVEMEADASMLSKPFGISCLHWLFTFEERDQTEVAALLIRQGAQPYSLIRQIKDDRVLRQIPSKHFPFHWPHGTPLHWAAYARSCSAIDILLQGGAFVDELDLHDDPQAQTALSMATFRGDSMIVKHLLSKGADARYVDGTGCSLMHMIAMDHYQKNTLICMCNALKWWIYHGSWEHHVKELTECARALFNSGADPNAQTRRLGTSYLSTPLLDAVAHKNPGSVIALLAVGASADCKMSWSQTTPIHEWVGCDSRSLHYPQAFKIVFDELLKSVDTFDIRDSRGRSIQHRAISEASGTDYCYILQKLTESTPAMSLEVLDEDSCTPLLLAIQLKRSNDEMNDALARSSYLLGLGVDIRVKDHDDRDFFLFACQNDSLSDSQCLGLLQAAIRLIPTEHQHEIMNKSMSRRKGTTPLMHACNNSRLESVRYLIGFGLDLNAISRSGSTAMDYALDTSAKIRQGHLNEWIAIDRKLSFNGTSFAFISRTPLTADLLRSKTALLHSELAMAHLFRRTISEGELGQHV